MKRNILLVGGIDKTKSLAGSLIKKGYRVTAINNSKDDCKMLAEIEKLNVIMGDGTDPHILDAANAAEADICIALTKKDEDNLVICQLAKSKFHVTKTVSLLSDIDKMNFFYKMGVDSVVCAISVITNIIEQQAIIDQITNTIPIGEGRCQISEVLITSTAPVVDKKIWEISLPKEVIIGCILRGDTTIIPRGDTRINEGDTLVIISSHGQEIDAIKQLTGKGYSK